MTTYVCPVVCMLLLALVRKEKVRKAIQESKRKARKGAGKKAVRK